MALRSRLGLDEILRSIAPNVYFQPPETIKIKYPCIVYSLDDVDIDYSDNLPYMVTKRYQLTVITKDPDSTIKDDVILLPKCSFVRAFTSDNLNHYVFQIYY